MLTIIRQHDSALLRATGSRCINHNLSQPRPTPQHRLWRVVVSAAKDGQDWIEERQIWIEREHILLNELSAVRKQVDKLLEQQHLLLSMLPSSGNPRPHLLHDEGTPGSRESSVISYGASSAPQTTPSSAAWAPYPDALSITPPATPTQSSFSSSSSSSLKTSSSSNVSNSSLSFVSTSSSSAQRCSGTTRDRPQQSDSDAGGSVMQLLQQLGATRSSHETSSSNSSSDSSASSSGDSQLESDILSLSSIFGWGRASSVDLPTSASSIAAAIAAVDKYDVLQDISFPTAAQLEEMSIKSPAASSSTTPSSGASTSASSAAPPVEAVKQVADGPPLSLQVGDDDIFWVNQLHTGLLELGFYPGDDDVENWLFGDSTQMAVLAFQASEYLPETGVVDDACWAKLAAKVPSVAKAIPTLAQAGQSTASSSQPSSGSSSSSTLGATTSRRLPVLEPGIHDIFWANQLHVALVARGFHPSDEDMEDWNFGESTLQAVLAFQASVHLPETGIVDGVTWDLLLKDFPELAKQLYEAASGGSSTSSSEEAATAAAAESRASTPPSSDTPSGGKQRWPVLMDMDGGKEVHALQLALSRGGYNCGDDEMQWWMFGDVTLNALRTFQACNGLPESGVCDERTWKALMGKPEAVPSDIDVFLQELLAAAEDDFDADLTTERSDGSVWLIGEQRWERKVK